MSAALTVPQLERMGFRVAEHFDVLARAERDALKAAQDMRRTIRALAKAGRLGRDSRGRRRHVRRVKAAERRAAR